MDAISQANVKPAAGSVRVFQGSVPYTVRFADAEAVTQARERVAYILSLNSAQVRDLVPTTSGGIFFTDCPNCNHGSQDRGRFRWEPQEPQRLTCLGCGETYPGNSTYPENGVVEVDAPGGTRHRFSCHQRADGKQYFFRAHADWWVKDWLERQTRDLAELYHATGDEVCARRAAEILLRFAEVYPGYALIFDYPYQPLRFAPGTDADIPGVSPYRTSKWSWWAIMDVSVPLTASYDAIRTWSGLDAMAGGTARHMIEHDLLGGMVRFNLGVPNWERSTHQPRVHKLLAAMVLRNPEWVHEAVRRYARIERIFLHDGSYQNQSPSYMLQMLGTLQVWNTAAAGYSDPPGFKDPVDGSRFDNLDLAERYPFHARLERTLLVSRFPDGRLLPVNDTWWFSKRGGPRREMAAVLLPGMGLGILGSGSGENQVHAYLNATDGIYHKQKDALSIGLFAQGRELLSDIGYTHTRYRSIWTNATMSHNTVVVDGRESTNGHKEHLGSRLREFVAVPGFQLVCAENLYAYPDRVSRFRRTLMLLGQDAHDAYLLDVFHVVGGRQHDYLLHGSADEDSQATIADHEPTPFAGTLLNPGVAQADVTGEWNANPELPFGMIRNLQHVSSVRALTLDMHLDSAPRIGTRSLVTAAGASFTAFLGQSPSVRRAEESDARLDDYLMPSFAARRQAGSEPLESIFAAAHEPLNGAPTLRTLECRRQGEALLLTVTHADGRRDYLAMRLDGSPESAAFETPDGTLELHGAWGLVRTRDGTVSEAHLVAAERLQLGTVVLEGKRGWSGTVTAVRRERSATSGGWFEVDTCPEPEHGLLVLHFADATSRCFNVTDIEPTATGARIAVLEDPGMEIEPEQVRLLTYPQRTIPGNGINWRLSGSTHRAAAAPQ